MGFYVARMARRPSVSNRRYLGEVSDARLAIRSSSRDEDTAEHSNAGAFESRIDVAPRRQAITEAVEQVVRSYGEHGIDQEVLVQPMVQNIAISGVVLSRDLEGGAPYYVINYDDFSGRSDTVTGGAESKTLFVHTANLDALRSPRMKKSSISWSNWSE